MRQSLARQSLAKDCTCYLETFYENRFGNPDVDETEIMRSESNSKYANGVSRRETFILYEN